MIILDFDTWKAEYVPRIYEDSGADCDEHAESNRENFPHWCRCEFLYTWELSELLEDEEDALAITEQRVWSWLRDGTIVSGIENPRTELLITKKPYTERMEII